MHSVKFRIIRSRKETPPLAVCFVDSVNAIEKTLSLFFFTSFVEWLWASVGANSIHFLNEVYSCAEL